MFFSKKLIERIDYVQKKLCLEEKWRTINTCINKTGNPTFDLVNSVKDNFEIYHAHFRN